MAQVTIETSHPRSVGTGITFTVWRDTKAADDQRIGEGRGYKKGDTISEPQSVLVQVDENGQAKVDEDVWEAMQVNGQHESFGFREVGGTKSRRSTKAADESAAKANDK